MAERYGDHPGLPKVEDVIGAPLSPYAVTKLVDELYADVFGRCYGTGAIVSEPPNRPQRPKEIPAAASANASGSSVA